MDTMTLHRFRELADAWGADVTRWPAAAQPAAARLLGGSEGDAGRSILGRAGELDAVLHAGAPAPVPAALRAAILASAQDALAAAQAAPGSAGEQPLSYAAEWFPRSQAGADPRDESASRKQPGDSAPRGTGADADAAARGTGAGAGAAARAAGAGMGRGVGAWTRLWSELGGLRMAGPTLAMALVLGVTLAEFRGDPTQDAGADAAPVISDEEVVDAALFGADYGEYTL